MNRIRIAVLGAALVLGMTATAEAQGGGAGRAGGARGGIGRLMTDITVSADVQTKIDTIVARYQLQQRELMGMPARGAAAAGGGGGGGGMGMQMSEEQRTKIAELTTKRNAEIRALLTPEQQSVFDKNVAAAPQGRGMRGGAARAGAPPPTL